MNDPGPVRFSQLKAYGRSGMHGYHARFDAGDEQTTAMERGTAVHAILFGTAKVCGYPAKARYGKQYDAFAAEHADCEILTMAEYEKARCMADAVRACELARPVLEGATEQTLLFKWNGMQCRATPDVRGADYITELKTTASSDPSRFCWDALRRHYHAQMRFQLLGWQLTDQTGRLPRRWPPDCFIVAVESAAPYPVTVFRIEPRALEVGEKLLMLWSERLKGCEASGEWPPYTTAMAEIDLPPEEIVYGDEEEIGELSLAERMLLGSQA